MKSLKITNSQLKKIITESVNQNLLQEGILDFISSLPSSVIDSLQQAAAKWIIEKLGFEPDSFFARAIINSIENIDLSDLSAVLSGDRNACETLVKRLLESVAEALVEKFVEETLDLDIDNPIASSIMETMTNAFIRDNSIITSISNVICGINFSDIINFSGINFRDTMRESKSSLKLQEKLNRIRKLEKNKK
jgi:hypothetical protein